MLELVNVTKTYRRGDQVVHALAGVSTTIRQGEFVSIMGASGSGKSTLLHIVGGLDVPSEGKVLYNGTPLHSMKDDDLSRYRSQNIGFIFQFFNLMPALTAWENVALPLYLNGVKPDQARRRALEELAQVDLSERANHRPHQMSGGQMQRVAIARALVVKPKLLLADEPTGNLDSATGAEVLRMIKQIQGTLGLTVVMVTHDVSAAAYGTRTVTMRDGKIVSDEGVEQSHGRFA